MIRFIELTAITLVVACLQLAFIAYAVEQAATAIAKTPTFAGERMIHQGRADCVGS